MPRLIDPSARLPSATQATRTITNTDSMRRGAVARRGVKQARQPAQIVQDRAQRRQLAQVELARPVGRYPGDHRGAFGQHVREGGIGGQDGCRQQIAACILALTCYGNRVGDFGVPGI